MKSVLMFLALVACSCAISPLQELKPLMTRMITDSFIQRLLPRDPVLPPLDDPLIIDDFDLDLAELNSETIHGNISLAGGKVHGLSNLVDDLVIKTPILQPIRVTFDLSADFVALEADHYSAAILLGGEDKNMSITGRGTMTANISSLFLALGVSIVPNLITNKIVVTIVNLDLGFTGLKIRAEDFMVNDQLVDWIWFDEEAVPLFEWIWEMLKVDVQNGVKDLLNDLLKDCTITEIIGGDLSCIALPGPAPTDPPMPTSATNEPPLPTDQPPLPTLVTNQPPVPTTIAPAPTTANPAPTTANPAPTTANPPPVSTTNEPSTANTLTSTGLSLIFCTAFAFNLIK